MPETKKNLAWLVITGAVVLVLIAWIAGAVTVTAGSEEEDVVKHMALYLAVTAAAGAGALIYIYHTEVK